MALIKSISGFRGTIGGKAGDNLTPQDIVESAAAYGSWLLQAGNKPLVVIGRDARISGALVSNMVSSTLQMLGISVIDLGLSTTPTVEMAVPKLGAGGGIILTASHNPKQWNALKLLNDHGEFLSAKDAQDLLALLESGAIEYATVDQLGHYSEREDMLDYHVEQILAHPLVAVEAVQAKAYKVVVDAVNSSGAFAMPAILEALGCEVTVLNGKANGEFAHNPEPLPHHLQQLIEVVASEGADLGVAVDPDVDRLALIGPGGQWIGEEYTLVTVADYILQHKSGPTVSNLSSTRALRDIATKHGQQHYAAAVGEVNVVHTMKTEKAAIGGEGNGGIIVPDLHYGRDALIGVALVLSYMARTHQTINDLRDSYPSYAMVKDKVALSPDLKVEERLAAIQAKYQHEAEVNTIDGLKLDFAEGWVHLRRSNTEPIVRIYAEAIDEASVQALVAKVKADFL